MTERENLLRLLRRQGCEYAPCQFSLCPALEATYRRETGATEPYWEHFRFPWRGISGPRLPEREPVDWRRFYPDDLAEKTHFDAWGVAHEAGSEAAQHMTRMRHPLERFDSLEQLQAYPYPAFDRATYDHLPGEVEALHRRGLAAMFTIGDMVWEIAWYLRGMPQLMMDMAEGDAKAVFLLDKVTELACVRAAAYSKAGVDVLHSGDDVGMQSRLMMSLEMWREWIKPRFARVIRAAKSARPDVLFSYHSCGYVLPLIEDFIECGVDVLNPVQPECMDFAEVHARFGDRLSFWGTLGTQTTMPFGTPEDVRRTVIRNLSIAGSKGGLLCTPTHLLEPEVPWANIEAYVRACQEFARDQCA
jgi:uroporphyrinogen decarboxylase